MVGPLAERDRHRHHGRAGFPGLDAGVRSATAAIQGAARPLGRGSVLAERADRAVYLVERLHLDWGHLADSPGKPDEAVLSSPETLGVRGGEWCGFGSDGEAPRDQRADDGGSLVFTSDDLEERIEILGTPRLSLEIKSDQPVAFLVARLCDVGPDGTSARISYGILNLCHRDGHDTPEHLVPGEWYRIEMELDDLAQVIPPGHSLRLSLSTGYWPMIWPTPASVTLAVRIGSGQIQIPVRPPADEDAALRPFLPAISAPGSQRAKLHHLAMKRRIEVDLATNEMTYTLKSDGGELGGAAGGYQSRSR